MLQICCTICDLQQNLCDQCVTHHQFCDTAPLALLLSSATAPQSLEISTKHLVRHTLV